MRYLLLLLCSFSLIAQEYAPINKNASKVVNIWPGKNPGDWKQPVKEQSVRSGGVTRLAKVGTPTLAFYPVKKENAPAVIVCPGGGYKKLAYDKEGEEIAEWLNTQGFNAFVLKYRLPMKSDTRHVPPLQDAQRSVSFVRSIAKEYKINPDKIGIMGFSAGGHLSAITSTTLKRTYEKVDEKDEFDFKVNFTILVYPAYLSAGKNNLSPLFKLTSKTPPTFIAHAEDDRSHFRNCITYNKAMKEAGADCTLKTYKTGGHGHGMRKSGKEADKWPEDLAEWLKNIK